MAQHSLLVVEDDTSLSYLITRLLERAGYQVTTAIAGSQALNHYQQGDFDLLLVDLRLPDTDGLTLLEEVKELDPEARVVIMTAFGSKETAVNAFRKGAVEYIEKPFENQDLLDVVEKNVQGARQSLQGDLRLMSLASIVQVNCEERNQSRLRVKHRGREGLIYFRDGEVVHAELGDLGGEQAVFGMLGWEEGTFQVEMDVSAPVRTINTGWSGLLLEGMRRLDERGEGWDPDQPEAAQQQESRQGDNMAVRVARALHGIAGLESVLIISPEGAVLAAEMPEMPEQEPELSLFIKDYNLALGEIIRGGQPQRLVITGEDAIKLYIPLGEDVIYCQLESRVSVGSIWRAVQTILRRYRSLA